MQLSLLSLLHSYPELILAVSSFLLFFLLRALVSGCRSGPPFPFPILGHTPYLFLHFHHLHEWFTDVLRATGCTYLFTPPLSSLYAVLLTCDPANMNHIFCSNFLNYPKGEDFADMFDFLGDGIFNADEESWKFQRRKAHSLMSSPRFRSFVAKSAAAKVKNSLLPVLDHFAGEGGIVDLQDVFLRLSFDNTCTLVFGTDPGCLSLGLPTVPFAAAIDDAEEAAFFRQLVPVTWWKILRRLRLGPEKKLAEAVAVMDGFIHKFIHTRREEKRGGADLLSSYLDSQAEIKEQGLGEYETFLRDTVVNLMLAGRDTTSSALTWFFYSVATNPSVEKKILDEVRRHGAGAGDLNKLVYLHAALCESLRLYPPVPFEHKGAVKPDVLPSGHEVDPTKRVLVSLYAMGRMKGVWGEDCGEFRPERWISPETGRVRREPSYKFPAFNAGPRSCLGKDVAFAQMKAVAAAVVERYRIAVAEGFVARPKLSIILHMSGGLRVRVSKREAGE